MLSPKLIYNMIKKLILFLVFYTIIFSANAQRTAIKTGPFSLALGFANIAVEYQFDTNISLIIKSNYHFLEDDGKALGFEPGIAGRYYLKQIKVLTGFYIQPQASYRLNSGVVSFDVLTGYQMTWHEGFVFDIGAGVNYYKSVLGPSFIVAFGYSF